MPVSNTGAARAIAGRPIFQMKIKLIPPRCWRFVRHGEIIILNVLILLMVAILIPVQLYQIIRLHCYWVWFPLAVNCLLVVTRIVRIYRWFTSEEAMRRAVKRAWKIK